MSASGGGLFGSIGGLIGTGVAKLANQPLYEDEDQLMYEMEQDARHFGTPGVTPYFAKMDGPTAYGDIREDPGAIAAQRAALSRMAEASSQNGMDPMARASLEEGRQAAAGMASGARAAQRSRMASRGMLGSGAALAADAGADSAAASRLSQTGYQAAAAAQQRQMNATQGMGNLSGDIRAQDYRKASDLARAKDEINAHNTASTNQARQYNDLLRQKEFESQLRRRQYQNGVYKDKIGYDEKKAQAAVDAGEAIGSTAGSVAGMGI